MIYSGRIVREVSMKRIASKRAPERSLDEALRIMDSLRQYRRLIKPARRKAGQCKG